MDPLAELTMGLSPYNYVVDNPIRNRDVDGMDYQNGIYENGLYGNTVAYSASSSTTFHGHNFAVDQKTGQKVPGSDTYYSVTTYQPQSGWLPLTKTTFLSFIQLNFCQNCSIGTLQDMAGKKFESLFDQFIKKNFLARQYIMRKTGLSDKMKGITGNTIPDYIGVGMIDGEVLTTSLYDIVAILELKATKNNIGIGSFGGQIRTQIEAARLAGVPELIIVTTYGVQLSQPLKNFALDNNVLLTHYWAEYKIINGQMTLNFKPANE